MTAWEHVNVFIAFVTIDPGLQGNNCVPGPTEEIEGGKTGMEFWEGERCEYCNGDLAERKVDLSRKVKGKYVLIENVPAGVCKKCGTRYYAANVLKTIEETIRGRRKAKREVLVPVYSL
jgi:HTH-type transcriptional regulator/antitoxin MqsA